MTDARPARFDTAREFELDRFLSDRYGLRGTLRLHRAALGWDLLRAPLNVALSPVFLLVRIMGKLMSLLGAKRAASWLAGRQVFLTSDVARRIEADLADLMGRLDARGVGPKAPPETVREAIRTHAETRNAVAEITCSLIVLAAGFALFHSATPGVMSLAGPVAHLRAQTRAVEDFALGSWIGGVWYGAFPAELGTTELVLTGAALAMLASVVTTFAGLVADPLQLWTGIHRRRVMRLLARLDRAEAGPPLAREHVLARLGDLSDAAMTLWRGMRG